MTSPLTEENQSWRVFRMDDYDWWIARSLEEAKASYKNEVGVDDKDIEDARELTEEELDRLHYVDVDEGERPVKKSRRTFRAELAQRIAAGLSKPELFACTEY